MDKLARQMMKYLMMGFIGIFLVLCAGTVKHIVEVDLPSDGLSVWMANLSTHILVDQQAVNSCDSAEDLLGDESQDLDDALISARDVEFFAWSDITLDGLGVCPLILWQPVPKIPIA